MFILHILPPYFERPLLLIANESVKRRHEADEEAAL